MGANAIEENYLRLPSWAQGPDAPGKLYSQAVLLPIS